jgi:hypothetical protein
VELRCGSWWQQPAAQSLVAAWFRNKRAHALQLEAPAPNESACRRRAHTLRPRDDALRLLLGVRKGRSAPVDRLQGCVHREELVVVPILDAERLARTGQVVQGSVARRSRHRSVRHPSEAHLRRRLLPGRPAHVNPHTAMKKLRIVILGFGTW